jgi:hypothetical protein
LVIPFKFKSPLETLIFPLQVSPESRLTSPPVSDKFPSDVKSTSAPSSIVPLETVSVPSPMVKFPALILSFALFKSNVPVTVVEPLPDVCVKTPVFETLSIFKLPSVISTVPSHVSPEFRLTVPPEILRVESAARSVATA